MVIKEWKLVLSILKDKASLIKATFSSDKGRNISTINRSIIKATTRTSTSPPSEYRIATVLNLGNETHQAARACLEAIMDRLHSTRSPYVALKCLIILHHIISKGSFILKDQFSFFPLKLTGFRHENNVVTWDLSLWVQWYASVLELNLITSRTLRMSRQLANQFDLLREIDSLVTLVEGICEAPESLDYEKLDLVHELMLLVSEDYRWVQLQIMMRLKEFGDSESLDILSSDDSSELILCLKRLEDCWPRLLEMFANRKRNDAFWELISQMKIKFELMNEKRERERLVVWKDGGRGVKNELTRYAGRVVGTSQDFRLGVGGPCGSQGLGGDQVYFSVSTALLV